MGFIKRKEHGFIGSWRPKNGDVYYWVRSDIGQVCKSEWASDAKHHEFRWSIGNVFCTRSDAERAIVAQQEYFKNKRR